MGGADQLTALPLAFDQPQPLRASQQEESQAADRFTARIRGVQPCGPDPTQHRHGIQPGRDAGRPYTAIAVYTLVLCETDVKAPEEQVSRICFVLRSVEHSVCPGWIIAR